MKTALLMAGAIASACLMAAAGSASAAPAPGPVVKTNTVSALLPNTYWTPERFRAAKALDLPMAAPGQRHESLAAPSMGKAVSSDPGLPTVDLNQPAARLFTPIEGKNSLLEGDDATAASLATRSGAEQVTPTAAGTFGAYYTSTRVFPLFTGTAAPYSADRAYPYRTVGKLFFSINGVPYLCSASVIQRRIVATAGHCVHSGNLATGFYSDFVFVPAYRDGTAPFKTWNWRVVTTTYTWATGNGVVPNAADYAMIEFDDQALSTGAPPSRLGNVTGWLGWQTNSLIPNHTSKLGYPCNLDACQKMQDVTSNSFRTTDPNNVEYGSDARGGSSGGPWVQNFQVVQVGGGTGIQTGSNRVVGVTSYGYVSEDPKVQGASNLDSRWVGLFNLLCGLRTGNCTP